MELMVADSTADCDVDNGGAGAGLGLGADQQQQQQRHPPHRAGGHHATASPAAAGAAAGDRANLGANPSLSLGKLELGEAASAARYLVKYDEADQDDDWRKLASDTTKHRADASSSLISAAGAREEVVAESALRSRRPEG